MSDGESDRPTTADLLHVKIAGRWVAVMAAPVPPPPTALMKRRKAERERQRNGD